MPGFEKHESANRTKVMLLGDSGAGKTSRAADLANAGYKVFILDFDDKLDILKEYLTEEGVKNVQYVTVKEEAQGTPTAWKTAKDLIWKKWVDPETKEDFGKVKDWGPDAVLFIDSISFMGEAAKNYAGSMNGKPVYAQLSQPEWGDAIRYVESTLDYLMSKTIKCNVVMTALPIAIDDENEVSRIYPRCVSKNFSTVVGKFFNDMIGIKSKRDGSRIFRTVSDARTEYKTSRPSKVDKEMPANLAEYFKLVQEQEG